MQGKTLNAPTVAQARQQGRLVPHPPPNGPPQGEAPSPLATLQTRPHQPHIHGQTRQLRPHPGEQEATPVHAHGPLAGATPSLTPGLSPEDGSLTSTPEEPAQPRLAKRLVVSDTPRPPPPRGLYFHSRTPRRVLHPIHVQAQSCRTLTVNCLPHPKQVQMGSLPPLSFPISRPSLGQTGTQLIAMLQTTLQRS